MTEWSSSSYSHWHECSLCGNRTDEGAHNDANSDHKCDICEKRITKCTDTNKDHKCDICGKTVTICVDVNKDHKCDICQKTLTGCVDKNKEHLCDICIKKLTDHTGGKATCKNKAICTICNLQYGDLADHDYKTEWSGDSTNHWHECPICGARKDEMAHTPGVEATETTPQVCTVCDCVIKDALGHIHNFNQQKTTEEYLESPATCTTKAVYCFSCACGERGVETFGYGEMLAHTWKTEWVVDEIEHRHECSACGAKGDGAGHAFERKIDKEASVTEIGTMHEECTICGYQKVSVAIDKLAPAIIEGMNGKWNKDDENGLVFKSNAAYADFVEVLVDGKVIPSDSYYIREGSIVVELKSSYLAELAEGKHTFVIRSESGDASTEFTVEAKIVSTSNGKASALIWIIVGIIALGGVVTAVIFIIRKRKKA